MAISQEVKNYYDNAVKMLNTKGKHSAGEAYKALSVIGRTPEEDKYRLEVLSKLNQLGRAWFIIAGVNAVVQKAKYQSNIISTSFGGVRTMFAVSVGGTYYIAAVDITVDVNGGVVATQWVTRHPVKAEHIAVLLAGSKAELRESELSGEYFEKYSEINAITSNVRRTPDAMLKAVVTRMVEKVNQMCG